LLKFEALIWSSRDYRVAALPPVMSGHSPGAVPCPSSAAPAAAARHAARAIRTTRLECGEHAVIGVLSR
jgi:hypothetical protein